MQYRAYGVTGFSVTCSPFCYLSRSPILATATQKVTEVTGKSPEKNNVTLLDPHAHEKKNIDSNFTVTSVTSVTYYFETTENTDSKEVTEFLSRSNFWCYPDFSLMHDLIGSFSERAFAPTKSSITGDFQNIRAQGSSAGGL